MGSRRRRATDWASAARSSFASWHRASRRPAPILAPATLVLLASLGLLLFPLPLFAQTLEVMVSPEETRPGDVVSLTVTADPSTTAVSVVAFEERWPAIRLDDRRWRGLIGIDLDRVAGSYDVRIEAAGPAGPTVRSAVLRVVRREFPRRVLKVAPEYVNPPADVLARIRAEAAFLDGVFASSDAEAEWRSGLHRPVEAKANSSFGTRSVFNGEARNPHTGTDFLSAAGTPIRAPAGGRVAAARDLFFSGNTIVIDHGLGVFSTLAHLSRIDVHEGDSIEALEVVGLVGATGRVTGAHLHWALRIGPARVDPLSALRVLQTSP